MSPNKTSMNIPVSETIFIPWVASPHPGGYPGRKNFLHPGFSCPVGRSCAGDSTQNTFIPRRFHFFAFLEQWEKWNIAAFGHEKKLET